MSKKFFLSALLLLSNAFLIYSQQIPCPPNLDFEFGDFTLWECQSGGDGLPGVNATGTGPGNQGVWPPAGATLAMCPGLKSRDTTPVSIGPILNRHTVTSASNGNDPFGNFPAVCPGGGQHSLRLGNSNMNWGADRVRYTLHVPAGVNNYSFNYQYAVVLQDPDFPNTNPLNFSHQCYERPRFNVSVIDSATGDSLKGGCYDQSYIIWPFLPGFFASPSQSDVVYKPWSPAILNISGAAGKTVIIDIVAVDCAYGGHWGYGYFDVIDCGQFKAAVASCDLDGQGIVLTGPPGYMAYEWWDQNYTTLVDTGRVANYTPPTTTPQSYNLVLIPFPSVSKCNDTIVTLPIANIDVQATPDTFCMTPGIPIQLDANATGGVGPLTYTWTEFNTPGNTLNCNDCKAPIATPFGTSFYTVKVADTNGCYRTDTLQIYYSVFQPNAGQDFTTCVGAPVTFNASVFPSSSALKFKWTTIPPGPNPGLNFDTLLNPTFTPTAPGTYVFQFGVDSIACEKFDTMQVTVLPDTFYIVDTTICNSPGPDTFQVNAQGDPNFTYSWTPSVGVLDPTVVNPRIATDTSRTYIVTASYPGCPTLSRTFQVDVQPLPDVDLGPDTSKCQWKDLFLVSSVTPGWYPNYSYQWTSTAGGLGSSTTQPNMIFNGQADATLKLVVKTPIGCSDSDEVNITVHQGNFATVTPAATAVCPGTPVSINAAGGEQYTWDPPTYLDSSNVAGVESNPVSDITYTIYVTDEFGCSDTLTSSIDVYADATLDAGNDITLYPGDTAQMNPIGNTLYHQWYPPMGLSATNVANPLVYPTVNTRYYVTGTTENGCVAIDSIDVIVSAESLLEMPNAFTPGASGLNNTLKLIRKGEADLKSLRIYDRWGTLVYETNDIDAGWDGRYKGTPQPMGVYVYIVEASRKGRTFYKEGNITLIR